MSVTVSEATAMLARTPAIIRAWMNGLEARWLECDEGPETWSPRDVLAHLADLEDQDWMGRVRIILDEGESRPFPSIDRVRFRQLLDGSTSAELVDLFAERRARNLDELGGLDLRAQDLARRGIHPAFGPVTLEQLVATWVVHDLTHLAQIARVMARRYDADVGPWREYLGVLSWRRSR